MPITIDLEQNPLFADIFKRCTLAGELQGEQRGEQRGIQIGEQRGEQRGIQIGEQRGELRGKILILHRLLEKKFGHLPNWVNSRLEQATAQQLEQWSLQLFDATHLDDVFKSL